MYREYQRMIPELDGESVASFLEEGLKQVGGYAGDISGALGSVTGTLPPTPETFMALLATSSVGIAQNKSVELAAGVDRKLDNFIEGLDEEDRKQAALVRGLQALSTALPDGSQWEQAVLQSTNGDPTQLVDLIREYSEDNQKRQQYERTFDDIMRGKVDADSEEEFVEFLQESFGVSDREDALGLFFDIQDLLEAREVHETLNHVCNIERDIETIQKDIQDIRKELDRYLDQRVRNEGFRWIDDPYFRLREAKPYKEALRTGMGPREVKVGYTTALSVQLDGETHQPPDIVDYLQEGRNLLIRGRPGSGKSTFAREVLYEWHKRNIGDVLYRKSGQTQIQNNAPIIDAIESADGHPLIVVEDAARAETRGIYQVIHEFENRKVSFLLTGRYGEIDSFSPAPSVASDTTVELKRLLDHLPKADIRPLTKTEVESIRDKFEAHTGEVVDTDVATLHERISSPVRAGELLHLAYLLLGTGGENTGLIEDVREKHKTVHDPESEIIVNQKIRSFENELVTHVALLINLCNAAPSEQFREEYAYALGVKLGYDIGTVEQLLNDALNRWLVFGGHETGYETLHEFWSFLYLRESIETTPSADEDLAGLDHLPEYQNEDPGANIHEVFAQCVSAMVALYDDDFSDVTRRRIERRNHDNEVFNTIDTNPEPRVETLLRNIYKLGQEYPVLEPLFASSNESELRFDQHTIFTPRIRAIVTLERGRMYHARGMLDDARQEFECCAELLAETSKEYSDIEAERLLSLGGVHRTVGEYEDALSVFEAARDIFEKIDGSAGVSQALQGRGATLRRQGNYDAAKSSLEKSLQTIGKKEQKQYASIRTELGNVALNRDDLDQAENHYEDARDIFRDIDDQRGEANSTGNLGLVAREQTDLETAENRYRSSLNIFQEIGDRRGEANSLDNLGSVAEKRRNLKLAHSRRVEALEIFHEIGDRSGEAHTLNNLGTVAVERGNIEPAEQYFERARDIFEEIGNELKHLQTIDNLISVYNKRRKTKLASEACETAIKVINDSNNKQVFEQKWRFELLYASVSN